MSIAKFEQLEVWQLAHQLTLNLYKETKCFPDDERFGITNQIRRSSSSVCANIVEGYKKDKKEFVRYLGIARGSLEETKYHLLLSKDLGYITVQCYDELNYTANRVGKMLFSLINTLRS